MATYRNRVTGRIDERPEPDPLMEAADRWERIDPDEPTAPAEQPDQAEEFDPADHTVPEVLAYMASAEPDEQARVLAAEQQGRDRRGISSGP